MQLKELLRTMSTPFMKTSNLTCVNIAAKVLEQICTCNFISNIHMQPKPMNVKNARKNLLKNMTLGKFVGLLPFREN